MVSKMIIRSAFSGLTPTVLVCFCLCACGENSQNIRTEKTQPPAVATAIFDSSKTAIITFDQKGNYPFNNSYKPARLTKREIQSVDSLLSVCVTNYNNSLGKTDKNLPIHLSGKDYKRQLIAVTNKNGDKEVWVNCFCSTWGRNWQKVVLLIKDGGNCYFNFKINLNKMTYCDLTVNGEA